MADLERAKPPDLDVPLFVEGILDCVQERVHHSRAILLGNHGPRSLCYLRRHTLDQVGFGH